MPFIPFTQPGPGRPKGAVGGRARALQTLDTLLAEDGMQDTLKEALRVEFTKNPVRFFRNIIMPLLPRDVMLKLGEEGVIKWTSLLDTFPMPASEKSITIEATAFEQSAAGDDGARPALPPPNS